MPEELRAALAASENGDSALALQLFIDAAKALPDSGTPYLLMAAEYAALGEMDKAEAGFAQALLVEPGLAIARYQLGLLQFSSGKTAAALLSWKPLLDLDSNDPLPHLVRGFAALTVDNFEDARRHFESGIEQMAHDCALAKDITMVLQGIEKSTARQTPAQGRSAEPQRVQDELSSHVLLSNYQQRGPLH